MPIEAGPYCNYCVDDAGHLQSFEDRFARMSQWMRRQEPALSQDDAEAKTLAYMATMPAWKDHPRVRTSGNDPATRPPRPRR
jgi:hypothetical protein